MSDIQLLFSVLTNTIYGRLRTAADHRHHDGVEPRDRGAVSLEQVLWFVAAGVSVAVIAAIVWNQIKEKANTPVNSPTAP